MDPRLRTAALSGLCGGLILLLAPMLAAPAFGQGIEATPLGPPGEAATPLPPAGEGRIISRPLDNVQLPDLPAPRRVTAKLGGLDKVTGSTRPFDVPVGGEGNFGRLVIRVKACHGREPDQPPEAAAFLQITDPLGDEDRLAFSGWMFASSPGLSAMDHARYDVWVLQCNTS